MSNLPYRTSVHNFKTPARPVEIVLERLEQSGCEPKPVGRGWLARCPAHDDRRPSLSVGEADDGVTVLLHCHAGCKTSDIVRALGLGLADLFAREPAPGRSRRLQRRRGLSEAELWRRYRDVRRRLRLQLAHGIRKAEAALYRAGPRILEDESLVALARRLAHLESVFARLLGEGSPDEQLEALVLAAKEVRRCDGRQE